MRTFALLVALLFGAATIGEVVIVPSHAEAGDKKAKKKTKKKAKKKSDKKKAKKKKRRKRKRTRATQTTVEDTTGVYLQLSPVLLVAEFAELPEEEDDAGPPPNTSMPDAATSLALFIALTEGGYTPVMADVYSKRTLSVRDPWLAMMDYIELWDAYSYPQDNTAWVGVALLAFSTVPGDSYLVTCRVMGNGTKDLHIREVRPQGDDEGYYGTVRIQPEWDDVAFVHLAEEMHTQYSLSAEGRYAIDRCDITPVE
jgi:hypothetical protein